MSENSSSRGFLRTRKLYTWLLHVCSIMLLVLILVSAKLYDDASNSARQKQRELSELFSVSTPSTATEAPGMNAWLDQRIRTTTGAWDDLERPRDGIPNDFSEIHEALSESVEGLREISDLNADITFDAYDGRPDESLVFRNRKCMTYTHPKINNGAPTSMAVTHRKNIEADAEKFYTWLAPFLSIAKDKLSSVKDKELTSVTNKDILKDFRIVRVYAISEDGSFISAPTAPTSSPQDQDTSQCDKDHLLSGELVTVGGRPNAPVLPSGSFYFKFDTNDFFIDKEKLLSLGEAWHSGFYIDAGGYGLVTSVVYPISNWEDEDVRKAVVSVDLALGIDWAKFAEDGGSDALDLEVVDISRKKGRWQRWNPWQSLRERLEVEGNNGNSVNEHLLEALSRSQSEEEPMHQVHHMPGDNDGGNSIAMFLVGKKDSDSDTKKSDSDFDTKLWLVVFVPPSEWQISWGWAALLLAVVVGIGYNRLRLAAEKDFSNLRKMISTMNIPLIVAESDDVVVYQNDAAERLGITLGLYLPELIPEDTHLAKAHYMDMHRLSRRRNPQESTENPVNDPSAPAVRESGAGRSSPSKRPRAYGVPLRVLDDDGKEHVRHVIIRSVSFTDPIEALNAERRHRLGIFFLLEPEADLKTYEHDERALERRRLASIFSHGVDIPSHFLARRLVELHRTNDSVDYFSVWLSEIVWRRLEIAEWLLDKWDLAEWLMDERNRSAQGTLAPLSISDIKVVGPSDVRNFFSSLRQIFEQVRDDRELRESLEWENGVLADDGEDTEVFRVRIFEWPRSYGIAAPIEGAVEFVLEEILVNAVKHGMPGSVPKISILQSGGQGLLFKIENEKRRRGGRIFDGERKFYGGVKLLKVMAILCGWKDLEICDSDESDTYSISWVARLVDLPTAEVDDPDLEDLD